MKIRTIAAAAALTIAATATPAAADRAALEQLVDATFGPAAAHARRIVACESSWNPGAKHRNRNGTTDYGLFQLNDGGTLQSLGLTRAEALDPVANVRAAHRLYLRRGWEPWACSGRHTRSRTLPT